MKDYRDIREGFFGLCWSAFKRIMALAKVYTASLDLNWNCGVVDSIDEAYVDWCL